MSKILIFGGGLQVISLARSLKECGHKADVLGEHNEVSRKSHFVDQCIDCDLSTLTTDWMNHFIMDNHYEVVIPMEDPFSDWLSRNKKEIESHTEAKCAVMEWEIYQLASNKTRLLAFCETNRIPHPRTSIIGENSDEVAAYVGFPALIKPSRSNGARGIIKVDDIEQFNALAPKVLAEHGECALQEYIHTKDYYYNAMLYRYANGTYANHCIIKILRFYPVKGGSCSLCVTIENEAILSICKQTLDALNWVGFADFDLLEKEDGDYRIIEINPRVPASVMAAAISGINFGNIIVSGALGKIIPKYEYKTGRYLRCLGLDIAWFFTSSNRFRAKPSWFKFFGKNIYYMEGGKKDFAAMCTSIWIGIKKQLNPGFRKQKAGMN